MDKKKKQQFIIAAIVALVSIALVFKFIGSKNTEEENIDLVSESTTKIVEESMGTTETEEKNLSEEEELFEDMPEGVILDGEEVFYEEDTPLNDFYKKQLEWMGADEEGDI